MAKKTSKKAPAKSAAKNAGVKKPTAKKATSKKAAAKKAAAPPQKNNPARSEVKPRVIRCIHDEALRNGAATNKPDKVQLLLLGTEDLNLERDLLIGGTRREALSQCYDRISHGVFEGGRISASEARDAESVGAAIDLVHTTANDK